MGPKVQQQIGLMTVYEADYDDEGCTRLHVNTDTPYSLPSNNAYATLIEAAPDLLAALHRSKEIFEEICFDLEDPRLACREGVSIIEAAIAKATSPQAR